MKSILLTSVFVIASASAALAGGTSTTNSWSNRVQQGTGTQQVKIDRNVTGTQHNSSQSIKMEA